MPHIKVHRSHKEEGYIGERYARRVVSGYHCTDPECVDKYKKAYWTRMIVIVGSMLVILVTVGVIWAYPSDQYVWPEGY